MATVTAFECCLFFLLLLQHVATITGNFTDTHWQHQCDPGSQIFACTVPNFFYKPNQNRSSLVAPGPVNKVRLAYPRDKILVRDNVFAYDVVLHETLLRPRAVQIVDAMIKTVELPLDLEYADFGDNMIVTVSAPAVNGSTYALRYLDLQRNRLSMVDNAFSSLVNLETLLLAHNHITIVDGSVLKQFTKLSGLHLGSCQLDMFPFADLPATLEWFIVNRNDLSSSPSFTGMSTPALKVLDLHGNNLKSVDIDALLIAAPNLQELSLENAYQPIEGAADIEKKLKEAGIVHDKFNQISPEYDVNDDDDDEWSHRAHQMHEAREHIFAGLLTVLNLGVMAWGGYGLYKVRYRKK